MYYYHKKNINIFNFIEITILLSIIMLSINHIIKSYTKESYQKKFLSQAPKYYLFFSAGVLGMYLGKLPLNISRNFISTFAMLVFGCLFAICYSHFYTFYLLNKNKR